MFYAYFFMAGAALVLLDEVIRQRGEAAYLKPGLIVAVIVCTLSVGLYQVDAKRYDEQRTAHIRSEMERGARTIEAFESPVNDFGLKDFWVLEYQYRYGEEPDIEFEMIPYADWLEKYGE